MYILQYVLSTIVERIVLYGVETWIVTEFDKTKMYGLWNGGTNKEII